MSSRNKGKTGLVKRHRLDDDLEERTAKIYSHLLNDPRKGMVLLSMDTQYRTAPTIGHKTSEKFPILSFNFTRSIEKTTLSDFLELGIVNRKYGEKRDSYVLNDDGVKIAQPIAAYSLCYLFSKTNYDIRNMLGQHNGSDESAVYYTVSLFKALHKLTKIYGLGRDIPIENIYDEMSVLTGENLNVKRKRLNDTLKRLAKKGILRHESKGKKTGMARYRWISEEIGYPEIKYSSSRHVKAVIDYMSQTENKGVYLCLDEMSKELDIEKRKNIQPIITYLKNNGFIEKEDTSKFGVTISVNMQLTPLCNYFEHVEEALRLSMQDPEYETSLLFRNMREYITLIDRLPIKRIQMSEELVKRTRV